MSIIAVKDIWTHDEQFRAALASIKVCCEVALQQGPLSRRNALREIIDMAQAASEPKADI